MQSNQNRKQSNSSNLLYALGGIALGVVGTILGVKAYDSIKQEQVENQQVIQTETNSGDNQIYESLCCPITGELINEAAQLNTCGHTFEKQALQAWLQKSQVCPQCRQHATQNNIIKNYALQEVLDQQRALQK